MLKQFFMFKPFIMRIATFHLPSMMKTYILIFLIPWQLFFTNFDKILICVF